ncbi:MAG: hypothetical protein KKD30_07660 [Gammaproteobacteria bacterium]|nr:hypothetical protein [Gammaproteobacteria bacterium]MBU0884280.1 hypothetical protein [Gammaproteobacteria bacterium]MBU1859818.1 hypothetical protein [Gammaproteobacteria bacterium]
MSVDGDFDVTAAFDDSSDELDSFENQVMEAATAELDDLLRETGGHSPRQNSSLVKILETYPDGSFPISEYSDYKDDTWILFKDGYGAFTRIHFSGLGEHQRALPEFIE